MEQEDNEKPPDDVHTKGIEMEGDFQGALHDLPSDNDKGGSDPDSSSDDAKSLDREMGEVMLLLTKLLGSHVRSSVCSDAACLLSTGKALGCTAVHLLHLQTWSDVVHIVTTAHGNGRCLMLQYWWGPAAGG